ncbi:MAG: S9 family peptidase [Alphaproteobacteria bacterium]|nr:MAG: S9 family peptidase [Alphaproteobacteria bacterium]
MSEQPPLPVPAPVAPRRPVVIEQHGQRREDAYGWLRSAVWQQAARDPSCLEPEIRAHLEAENAWTAHWFAPHQPLVQTLSAELKARLKPDEASVPVPDGPWRYGTRYQPGGQHPLWHRLPREGGAETLILDGDAEAKGHPFFRVAAGAPCPHHRLFAYAVDVTGGERYSIRVRDIATGQDLADRIEDAQGDFVWAADGTSLLYTELDEEHRPRRVRLHRLGAPPADAAVVYHEPDPGFFVSIGRTADRRWALITPHDHETSEVWVLPLAELSRAPECLAPRHAGVEYSVEAWGDHWVIITNRDQAEDFQVMTAPLAARDPALWQGLVPHRPGCLILGQSVGLHHHVRIEREAGLPRFVVRTRDHAERRIAFEEAAYSLGLDGLMEYDQPVLRFTYSSLATPQRVFEEDLVSGERRLLKEQVIPSGHDPARYRVERLFAPAPDGELVPVTVLTQADHPLDGSRPLLLYAYGAYGHAMPASFSPHRFSLVDRGFAYAIAHIRGGTDCGWRWYTNGKRAAKPNSFTDFLAAADTLIAKGVTSAGRIVAQGGSAGGMVMGAITNLRPALFAGVIAEVPFVDVLNTMSDASLPLTPPEWPEWGNPITSVEDFHTIRAYSPYENVRPGRHPAVFALAGLSDPRVTYWEPAKWIAGLRHSNTADTPILLKTNMTAGHGGAAGRYDRLEEMAETICFAVIMTKHA